MICLIFFSFFLNSVVKTINFQENGDKGKRTYEISKDGRMFLIAEIRFAANGEQFKRRFEVLNGKSVLVEESWLNNAKSVIKKCYEYDEKGLVQKFVEYRNGKQINFQKNRRRFERTYEISKDGKMSLIEEIFFEPNGDKVEKVFGILEDGRRSVIEESYFSANGDVQKIFTYKNGIKILETIFFYDLNGKFQKIYKVLNDESTVLIEEIHFLDNRRAQKIFKYRTTRNKKRKKILKEMFLYDKKGKHLGRMVVKKKLRYFFDENGNCINSFVFERKNENGEMEHFIFNSNTECLGTIVTKENGEIEFFPEICKYGCKN